MFEGVWEWWASKSSARFHHYREARLSYEAYLAEQAVPFDALTEEHYPPLVPVPGHGSLPT
jgi:hypothetical protein